MGVKGNIDVENKIELKYDGVVSIATGRSRRETKWKNHQVKWSELIKKLSSTTYTAETLEEYKKLPKSKQDDIKDVGGFVGGTLKGERRRGDSIISRTILTLDVDYAIDGLWDIIEMLFDFSCCMYSTHKHCKENPRLRLVIPLSRPVSPEEYEAVGRKVACDIGIDFFDDTTYEPSRLMYFPSTSCDGVYDFNYLDTQWLNPDEILGRYEDFRDCCAWPQSSRVKMERGKSAEKQGSPREKTGIIGAFCRTYSVVEVIEKFLSHAYVPCDDENRYTYVNGSTTEGLVIYENGDFAFSHHSTDPASGKLCNAFDLVRIHKFSHLDEKADINESASKLPSYVAMLDFAREDEEVKLTLGEERLKGAREEFEALEDDEDVEDFEEVEGFHEGGSNCHKEVYENIEGSKEKNEIRHRGLTLEKDLHEMNLTEVKDNDISQSGSKVEEVKDIKNLGKDEVKDLENNETKTLKNSKTGNLEDNKVNISEKDKTAWTRLLAIDKRGNCESTIENIVLILGNDPYLKGKIALNEFSHRTMIRGTLPWHRLENKKDGDPWKDSDDAALRHYLERVYKVNSPNKVNDAVLIIEEKNKYHPIREYLNGLTWDGVPRLDNLLIDYLGAEDSDYIKAVTRKTMVAAVARVFRPGVKFDYMLVLVGKQGIGKSHIVSLLGQSWYSDSLNTVQGKEAYEQLQDAWLIEMAELSATRKAEAEAVKHFISKRDDIYRVAYGRRVTKFPRQCVFFGTTNDGEFLKDKTGNRRFWPVVVGINKCKKNLWKNMVQGEINEIWAEAVDSFQAGESLFLQDNVEKEAIKRQEQHTEESVKEGLIREYLEMRLPDNWSNLDIGARRHFIHSSELDESREGKAPREKVCAMEIWVELFQADPRQMNPMCAREINDVLRKLKEWELYQKGSGKLKFGKNYGLQRAFVRKGFKET